MKVLKFMSAAVAAFSIAAACGSAVAQDSEATPEKLALAREVFQTTNLPQMMDGLSAMTNGMSRSLASKLPEAQQAKMAAFQQAMHEEMKQHFVPKMVDQMATLYAKNFSEAELRSIIAFYKSPTGQALLQKMPALMQQLSPLIMQDVPELMRGTVNRYCVETTCTAEERGTFEKNLGAFYGTDPGAAH